MDRTIDVVGAVILREGLVYCVRRGPTGSLPHKWEFPGGKIEHGEDGPSALTREIKEELLCEISVGDKITTTTHAYDFGVVRLTTYYCTLTLGEPALTEHNAELWLPYEKLGELDWAPADLPAVDEVVLRHTRGINS